METRIILIVGSILLSCGCIALLIARLSNPILKGLGWLGASFAAGAAGAAILAFGPDSAQDWYTLAADTLILLAFVFVNICILQLIEDSVRLPRFCCILLFLQFVAFGIFHHFHQVHPFSVITLGILVSASALQTAAHLKKSIRPGIRAAGWFTIFILVTFAAFNIFRSVAIFITRSSLDPQGPNPYQIVSVIVFLSTGLGLGFAIFWMASSQIRVLLEQMANTDPLTGILNRRSFLTWCDREILRSTRTGEPFSLLMLDIDHFKQINDRYGHPTGAAVLQALVEKLRDSVRNVDIVARWGGEEFVALLPGADSKAAIIVAQRLRGKVESLAVTKPPTRNQSGIRPPSTIGITISVGVATYLGPTDSIEALFHRCDAALYKAKAEGRNRVV